MTKQSKITDVTREKICDSFWDLYKAKPIRQITVGEVAEAAGVHRSTFYRYFHDVYEIYEIIIEEEAERYQQHQMSLLENNPNATPEELLIGAMEYTASRGEFFYLLFCGTRDSYGKNRLMEKMRPFIYRILQRDPNDPATEYYAHMLHEISTMNQCFWYEHRDELSLMDVTRLSLQIMTAFHGMGAVKKDT